MHNLYLYLNIIAFSGPFLLSFDRKVAFYKQWKYLFPAIAIMAVFFIAKDAVFAARNIWSFNDDFVIGIRWLGLPFEEWLFFFVVPYATVFIYACLKAYLPGDPLKKIHRPVLLTLSFVLLVVAAFNMSRIYTSVVFVITALLLFYNLRQRQAWLSMFLLAYLISWIPFLIMNGILTGSFIENPVVSYDPQHNLNIRVMTIPIEDSVYNLLMLMMTIPLMEWFKKKY